MATRSASSRRRATPAEAAAAPDRPAKASEPAGQATLDTVIDGYSEATAKEHLAWEIAACTAWLRGAQAVRETQLAASRRAQQAHEGAAERLRQARTPSDIAAVQLELARSNAEGALALAGELAQVAAKNVADLWAESANGLARLHGAALNGALQWRQVQARMPQDEAIEAEVDHVTSPIAASPLVWPAQEATRQAMTLAASTWNDLLSWPAAEAARTQH
jgi:hypothetical protein